MQKVLLLLCLIPSLPHRLPHAVVPWLSQEFPWRLGDSRNCVTSCLKSSPHLCCCRKVRANRLNHKNTVERGEGGETQALSPTRTSPPAQSLTGGATLPSPRSCSSRSGGQGFGFPARMRANAAELADGGKGRELAAFLALLEQEGRRS